MDNVLRAELRRAGRDVIVMSRSDFEGCKIIIKYTIESLTAKIEERYWSYDSGTAQELLDQVTVLKERLDVYV